MSIYGIIAYINFDNVTRLKNMSDLILSIKKLKNIKQCEFEIPLEKGLYAIVGENGCGKSTLMMAMSLLVKPSSTNGFQPCDYTDDSMIELTVDSVQRRV